METEQIITNENSNEVQSSQSLQQKKKRKITKFHRIHAHRNPLSDGGWKYPPSPDLGDWSEHYPVFFPSVSSSIQSTTEYKKQVDFADVGCGYGGLLVALGEMFPDNLSLGIEIRTKVVEYVHQRILKLREENNTSLSNSTSISPSPSTSISISPSTISPSPSTISPSPSTISPSTSITPTNSKYQNISVLNTNAMKYLPNFFYKGQLKKIFFLFPDPHFKKANHRRRIISPSLLPEYAYVLSEGGKLYTVTDVKELYDWEVLHLDACPLFERVSDEENYLDPVVNLVLNSSEESRKVDKAKGSKYLAVYRRKQSLSMPGLVEK